MKTIPIRSIRPKDQRPDVFEGFKIRSINELLGGTDMNQDLHRHDFYFMLIITKGTGSHAIDFIDYPVTNNSIYIMRPGQVHKLRLKAGSEGYLLEFNKEFQFSANCNALLRKAANRNFCKVGNAGMQTLCTPLQSMLDEYQLKKEGFETVMKANLEIFLIQFLRYRQHFEPASAKANTYQQEKLQELMDLLEANIHTTRQVAAYADKMHLSPFQLNSITKSLLGKTVAELIDDQIMLEAKRYLLATTNQVNQIAFELGYEDVSYFIRFFKKRTGATPEAFRKNLH
ncbi:MAG: AraC family transcriptional regulator [Cyclobacteriaceae bacterium]|jgi:AraC-like DNA-binding protein|nr:AraC family transcriptional regulator [Cyclobacteriaceae bacterium]